MGIIRRKSFTLIELIVAVSIIALILPAVFNIFFIMIRQQLVLISYQEIVQQGDSAERNIQNILQNRAAYITDSSYSATDICPLPLTPTPPYSPDLYINDRDHFPIHLHPNIVSGVPTIASDSASKTYFLTSSNVTISNFGFTCHRINEFTPATISIMYTASKSAAFKEVSLPYSFNVRLRNY